MIYFASETRIIRYTTVDGCQRDQLGSQYAQTEAGQGRALLCHAILQCQSKIAEAGEEAGRVALDALMYKHREQISELSKRISPIDLEVKP